MSIQSGIVNKDLIVKGMGFFSKDVKIKGNTAYRYIRLYSDPSPYCLYDFIQYVGVK